MYVCACVRARVYVYVNVTYHNIKERKIVNCTRILDVCDISINVKSSLTISLLRVVSFASISCTRPVISAHNALRFFSQELPCHRAGIKRIKEKKENILLRLGKQDTTTETENA